MDPSLSAVPGNTVSSVVIEQLARTKGWTRFMSVMLWIGSIFLILGGIAMVGIGALGGAAGGGDAMAAMGGAVGGLTIGVIYILMAALYIYPAAKLGKFSSRVNDLMATPTESNLAIALNEQRAFWKFIGVMMIIMISLYLIAIPVMFVGAGMFGAMAGG